MRTRLGLAAPWLWGVFLAVYLCRFFFVMPPQQMFVIHEGDSYMSRVVEFLALLRAGYLFPQWASDFRGGLGGPYFGYYQPGFFYLASGFATFLPVARAVGATLVCLAVVGYAGVFALVRERFGVAAGVLAGTLLLGARYTWRDLYLCGDLSEFSGMMALPVALWAITGWLERGRPAEWRVLAVSAAALVGLVVMAALGLPAP